MTAQQAKRILDMLGATPEASATLIARTLNVSRPYVYDVARSAGYERHNKRWEAVNDTQVQNDLQYQMLTEIHSMAKQLVENRDSRGRAHVELPQPFQIIDGHVSIPMPDLVPLGDAERIEKYGEALQRISTSESIEGLQGFAQTLLSAILYRIKQLN